MNQLNVLKKITPIQIILICFGIIFCSISFINHFNYRTYAFDLGLFNNALFDFAHFRSNDCVLMKDRFSNPLADHFSLITPLVSPIYWFLGSYSMLMVQIVALLLGGFGVYTYFKSRNNIYSRIPELAAIHFFSMWGIYSALAFDYHDNVVAACIVPWFIYYFEQKRKWPALLTFVAILITKENMALWAVFISLGLAAIHYKDKKLLFSGIVLCAIASVYFVLVVKVLMPHLGNLNPEKGYHHFAFKALGNNLGEALTTIVTRPFYFFKLFFINHLNWPEADGIKREMYITLFLSGGFVLFFKPKFFIFLIPIFGQKVLNDFVERWGLNYQYSIEFVPVISIALFIWISSLTTYLKSLIFAAGVCVSTLVTTFHKLEHRVSLWYEPLNARFYSPWHYGCDFDREKIEGAMALIPDTAKVSASSPLVSHLAFRDVIYLFPVVDDADYILLVKSNNPYPLTPESFNIKLEELFSDPEWESLLGQKNVYLFHRKKTDQGDFITEILQEKNYYNDSSGTTISQGLNLENEEFGPTFRISQNELITKKEGEFITTVSISLKKDSAIPKNSLFLVSSIETQSKESVSYKSLDVSTLSPDAENNFVISLSNSFTNPILSNSFLVTYIWNKEKMPVYINSMKLSFKGRKSNS